MKRFIYLILSATIYMCVLPSFSQTWCTLATCSPFPCNGINTYGSGSPVITNVTFNTINRSSATSQKELYVNTGVSTTVVKGQSYNFSMTYSQDASVCSTYNTVVWVDWNLNYVFDAATEEILTTSASSTGTLSGNITVPSSAATGTTRMRVIMKMDIPCGHTAIDPCLVTDDASVGWHGEVEDYTIVVTPASGVIEYGVTNSISVFPNPFSTQTTLHTDNLLNNATLTVYNFFGQTVAQIKNISGQTITFSRYLSGRDNLASGLYFVRLTEGNKIIAVDKLVITDK